MWLASSGKAYAPDALAAAANVCYGGKAGESARREALERLIAVAPMDARTWAVVLQCHWNAVRRACDRPTTAVPLPSGWKPPPLTREERRAVEEAIRHGRERDPHNALWTVAEMTLADADRDAARTEAAALKLMDAWYFKDYWREQRQALVESARRLGHSRYRAVLLTYEDDPTFRYLVPPIDGVVERVAALEAEGRHREALRLYAALLHLDRLLLRARSAGRYPERYPVYNVARLAAKRYERLTGPGNTTFGTELGEARRQRALDSLTDYALAHGDTAFVLRAESVSTEWRTMNVRYREERGVIDRLLGPILIASGFWWLQLILLALCVVAACGTLVLCRIAAGLKSEPQSRFALGALGPAIVLTSGLVVAVVFGLAPPSYGLGAASSPPTTTARVVFVVFVALAALASRFLIVRSPVHSVRKVGDGAFVACRWLAVACSLLYVGLTLGQAWFQSWAAAKLLPW